MKRVAGWTGAVILAVLVLYHVLSTGSFLIGLFTPKP